MLIALIGVSCATKYYYKYDKGLWGLIGWSIYLSLYIIDDLHFITNGYSMFLIPVEYDDEYVTAFIKMHIDFIGVFITAISYICYDRTIRHRDLEKLLLIDE